MWSPCSSSPPILATVGMQRLVGPCAGGGLPLLYYPSRWEDGRICTSSLLHKGMHLTAQYHAENESCTEGCVKR